MASGSLEPVNKYDLQQCGQWMETLHRGVFAPGAPGGPGKQARRRCAAWPEPRWGSLPDGSQLKTRVVARQQGEFQPTINSQVSDCTLFPDVSSELMDSVPLSVHAASKQLLV
ncbi:MAG: hypothetical protein FRX49_01030 [Trebouxia sp. A1-2]|nr:MAG: hypothetical protein FRX49_01030 [Trebouxia sp. A1-2]